MIAINLNNSVRILLEKIIYEGNYDELLDFLKQKSAEAKYVAGVLYETSYIINFNLCDEEESQEEINLSYLDEIYNIDEFIDTLDIDKLELMCNDVFGFNNINRFEVASFFKDALILKNKFMNVFPGYILDLIFYLKNISAQDFVEQYYLIKEVLENKKDKALVASINYILEGLEEMFNVSHKDFSNIILEMALDSYKYNKFEMLKKGANKEEILFYQPLLKNDLDSFVAKFYDDADLMFPVAKGFLKYNIASEDQRKFIDSHVDSFELNTLAKIKGKICKDKDR